KDAPVKGETLPLTHCLDKGDLVDLFERRHAQPNLVQSRLAQEPHSFFARRTPNLRGRLLGENHLAHAIAQVQQFVNSSSPAESGAGTFNASRPFVRG